MNIIINNYPVMIIHHWKNGIKRNRLTCDKQQGMKPEKIPDLSLVKFSSSHNLHRLVSEIVLCGDTYKIDQCNIVGVKKINKMEYHITIRCTGEFFSRDVIVKYDPNTMVFTFNPNLVTMRPSKIATNAIPSMIMKKSTLEKISNLLMENDF